MLRQNDSFHTVLLSSPAYLNRRNYEINQNLSFLFGYWQGIRYPVLMILFTRQQVLQWILEIGKRMSVYVSMC